MTYLKSHTPAPRLSGSIWILVSLFSLFLITACGGGGLKLDVNLSTPESRLVARCLANPFTKECNNPPIEITDRSAGIIADAREGFITGCVKDATSELCDTATTFVCTDETGGAANPFADLCQTPANEATYALVRESTISTCIDPSGDLASDDCINAIKGTCKDDAERTANPVLCAGSAENQDVVDTCDSNPFNSACDGNPIYIAQRNAYCAGDTTGNSRCAPLILSTCTYDANDASNTGDPFNALCRTPANSATYETPRNDIITACTTNLLGRLCPNATTFACKINPFHVLCYDSSATVFQTARQTAVTNCGDGTTTITEQVCADAVAETCEGSSADTFNALCGAYSGQPAQMTACSDDDAATRCYLQEQIDVCARGDEVARCAQVGTGDISTCTADPFAAACVAAGSPFAPYLSGAQAKRYDFCGAVGISDIDPRCTSYRACDTALNAGTTVPDGCGVNFDATLAMTCEDTPFDPQCARDIFDDNKVAFCMINTGGVNNLFNPNCTAEYRDDTARNTFCTNDPFHASCKSNVAYADARADNCEGMNGVTPHASCVTPLLTEIVTGPQASATAEGHTFAKFSDRVLSVTLAADGSLNNINGVLKTTITTPVPENAEEGAVPTVTTTTENFPALAISDVHFGRRGGVGSTAEPNTNPDGYVFFKLTKPKGTGNADVDDITLRTSQHVAILPTTNLGAPLTSAPVTAVWPGHFSTTENTTPQPVDFYIKFTGDAGGGEINFSNDAGTGFGLHISPTLSRPEGRPAIAVINELSLDVRFNGAGQLYRSFASIRDATVNPTRLFVTGFIGEQGVVAAFYTRDAARSGAGGFTASNPDYRGYVEAIVPEDLSTAETDGDNNTSVVNYEDWNDSAARPAAGPTDPGKSQFLRTTDLGGLAGLTSGQAVGANFANADFRSRLLKGNAINGFTAQSQNGNYYAGVLNTANLGAPITTSSGSAIWRGYLVAQDSQDISAITDGTIRRRFDLTINFSSNYEGQVGELKGTVRESITNLKSGLLYTIDGRFNARGSISGTISRREGRLSVPLSGIIGQTGAIGVFVSNETGSKFSGGFVAIPSPVRNVTYSDVWTATHAGVGGVYGLFAEPRAAENHWLEGGKAGTNGQSVKDVTDYNGGILRMSAARWSRTTIIGTDVNDAVAYYTGLRNGGRQFYSGVTSGTDLGRPLTQTEGDPAATWYGQLSARQYAGGTNIATNYGDITLTVSFNTTGGTIIGELTKNKLTSNGYTYKIRGAFNEDGFMSGNVNSEGLFGGTGYLSGLIGQQGMVGAFVSNNFSGGFVAREGTPAGFYTRLTDDREIVHYSTNKTTYQDWAHFAGNSFGVIRSTPHNEAGLRNAFLHTNASQNHNIIWGDIGRDAGREHTGRGAVSVAEALGQSNLNLVPPAGLKGGYSWLAGYWDRPSTHQIESVTSLNRGYHGGLFSNIDVGLPLGNTSRETGTKTAYWNGHFYAHQNKTFADSKNTSASIRLLINYGTNREISTTYSTVDGNRIGGIYTISGPDGQGNATWDERGVIHGRIHHKESHIPSGNITGLIGREGLIAVFVSDPDTGTKPHYGYVGGFVACPTLTTAHNSGCIK